MKISDFPKLEQEKVPLMEAKGLAYAPSPAQANLFEGVSLALYSSEMVTLMGPNGSGKSTLAKTLLGFLTPQAGHIQRRPGLRCGYLPQSHGVFERSRWPWVPLSARGYLGLHPRFHEPKLREQALRWANFPKAWMDRPWGRLSGGQRQRLFLARALLNEPELLILDEPSSHLDLEGQQQLQEVLSALQSEWGCGLLVISHDLHWVMAQSDRVICFDHQILCTGSPMHLQGCATFQNFLQSHGGLQGWALYAHGHNQSASESASPRNQPGACA